MAAKRNEHYLSPDLQINLRIDFTRYKTKPDNVGKVINSTRQTSVSGQQLEQYISHGCSFTIADMSGTTGETVITQRLLAVDIDNAVEEYVTDADGNKVKTKRPIPHPMTIDEAISLMRKHSIEPYIIYESFSSKPDWKRFRILVCLNPGLNNDQSFNESINRRFVNLFNRGRKEGDKPADTSCTNQARVFFGTTPDKIVMHCTGMGTEINRILALPDPQEAPAKPVKSASKPHTSAPMSGNGTTSEAIPHPAAPADGALAWDAVIGGDGNFDIEDLLRHLDPTDLSSEEWLNVMMALKNEGVSYEVADAWCSRDTAVRQDGKPRYQQNDNFKRWKTFKEPDQIASAGKKPFSVGYIFARVREQAERKGIDFNTIQIKRNDFKPASGTAPEDQKHFISSTPAADTAPAKNKRPRLTLEILHDILTKYGYALQYNVVTGTMEIFQDDRHVEIDDLVTDLHSYLGDYFTGCTLNVIDRYVVRLAGSNEVNPVLDYINALTWDGHDYIADLFSLMKLHDDDELSRILIRKWLKQGYMLLHNTKDEYTGASGVLVLTGDQRCGKTQLLKRLAIRDQWFLEGGDINRLDKDNERRVITHWISELGEIESTFKRADIDALKNFITRSLDEYRLPYGVHDVSRPRYTNICATANSADYLRDETGNSRYYTVAIDPGIRIPYDDIRAFNAAQLWAQVASECREDVSQCGKIDFVLTSEEYDLLAERNGERLQKAKGEDEVLDVWAQYEQTPQLYEMRLITITQWMGYHDKSFHGISAAQVAKILRKHNLISEEVRTKHGRLVRLPVYKSYSSES